MAPRSKRKKKNKVVYSLDEYHLWQYIINNVYNYNDSQLPLLLNDVTLWETNGSNQMRNINHFKCLVCNYDSKKFKSWKVHILSVVHVSMCLEEKTKLFSYACGVCKILFYGPETKIKDHQLQKHSDSGKLPSVFILMEELLRNFSTKSNELFFCTHCKTFTEKSNHDFDVKKYPKTVLHYCTYCRVTFLCSNEVLDCHFLSAEHITFKCISFIIKANKLKQLEKTTSNVMNKTCPLSCTLPNYILNHFQNTHQSKAKCKTCNNLVNWKAKKIVRHIHLCKNIGQVASNANKTAIKTFDCIICKFITDSFSGYLAHVISSTHISKSHYFQHNFSFFCTMCNLYMYSPLGSIEEHSINTHNEKETRIPLLSQLLKNNFAAIVKKKDEHSDSKYIDYFDDKQSNKKDVFSFPIKCHICKINFFTSISDYMLHTISSEHIILKYFVSNYLPSAVVIEANECLQLGSNSNAVLIESNKTSNKALNRLTKQNPGSNVHETEKYKGHVNKRDNHVVSNNTNLMRLEPNTNYKGLTDSQSSFTNFGHSVNKNYGNDLYSKTRESSPVVEVTPPEFVEGAVGFDDVSISSDYEDSINESCDEHQSTVIQQEPFVVDITKNVQTPLNNTSTCLLNKKFNSMNVLQDRNKDKAYGQYVTQRLKSIHNESLKSEIKLEIDYLIYSKIHF